MKKPIVGILLALFISSAAHGEPALRKVNRLIILYNNQLDMHRQKAAQAKLRDLSPQEKAVIAKFNTAFAGFARDQNVKLRPYVTALQTEVRKTPRHLRKMARGLRKMALYFGSVTFMKKKMTLPLLWRPGR